MRDLNLKKWHRAQCLGYITDASFSRENPKKWFYYMGLARQERIKCGLY